MCFVEPSGFVSKAIGRTPLSNLTSQATCSVWRSMTVADLDSMEPATAYFPSGDRKSTRLNSSHGYISYAVFCLKKKSNERHTNASVDEPDRREPSARLGACRATAAGTEISAGRGSRAAQRAEEA